MRSLDRRTLALALCVALPLAAGCRPDADPIAASASGTALVRDEAALFQTGALAYELRTDARGYHGELDARFTNRTGAPVYFVNCNGATDVQLERQEGDAWVRVWSPPLPQCLSAPIVVPPGGTHDFRLPLVAGPQGSTNMPAFDAPTVAGVYRLVWGHALASYQERLPFGDPLPLAQRTSNPFRLSEAP